MSSIVEQYVSSLVFTSEPNQKQEQNATEMTKQAMDALRLLAMDETAKAMCDTNPLLKSVMRKIAHRYIAGETTEEVIPRLKAIRARGHAASVELMGESCRDEARANHATEIFLQLIDQLNAHDITCSISLDLSHIGSVIDPELGDYNVRRIAVAAAESGRELMISMEGSERTDQILSSYVRLHQDPHADFSHVGITLQARLHRTKADFANMLAYPGKIRLVKGAYFETSDRAHERESPELFRAYLDYAKTLLTTGRKCSIATHDTALQQALVAFIKQEGIRNEEFEFESLMGLGTQQIDDLHAQGFATREYAVYGDEYFLYVLNRIAENPVRLYQAVVDACGV
ncbi:proline dehydrogenase family protein [Undibacterium cyanobacteriorum]|uniref:Proline dehydrogenase family protein n=1 Tax=Undibacterium cyanobacteriorum TaxID=3073561 RepID=A0ABY9RI60_9BURK|nr:proline dehydrogenase family protein [Undibacterium sp. 20NA77.5]WMW80903.1 proline dehydrogenase family protein [Undibacterium sp. 20NA77.5]